MRKRENLWKKMKTSERNRASKEKKNEKKKTVKKSIERKERKTDGENAKGR